MTPYGVIGWERVKEKLRLMQVTTNSNYNHGVLIKLLSAEVNNYTEVQRERLLQQFILVACKHCAESTTLNHTHSIWYSSDGILQW